MNLYFNIKNPIKIKLRFLIHLSILLIVFSCDPEESDIINAKYTIRGEVRFLDILTGEVKSDSDIEVSIFYLDNPEVVDSLPRNKTGSSFEFGPLLNGEYQLNFKLIKENVGTTGNTVTYTTTSQKITIQDANHLIDNPIILTASQGNRFFIRGRALYPDPISGENILDDNIATSLSPIDPLNADFTNSATGSYFEFGPLPPGNYDLQFQLTKTGIFEMGDSFKFEENQSVELETDNINLPDVILTQISGNSGFIKGNLSYTNIISETTGLDFSNVSVALRPLNEMDIPIGNVVTHSVNNSYFILGPFSDGKYEMVIKNQTSSDGFSQDLEYNFMDTISLTNSDTLEINNTLNWDENTALLVQITDSLSNNINAKVCIYNNLTFLEENLPDCEGAIDIQTTNSNGYVLFQNLNTQEYYFNVTAEIGSIMLNNHDSLSTTKSNILLKNALNKHNIKVYHE